MIVKWHGIILDDILLSLKFNLLFEKRVDKP